MGPEMSQFLSGMKRTIEQVILPSLSDRFAQEQAGMVAATLGFLAVTHDKVFHYELLENYRYKQILGKATVLLDRETLTQPELEATIGAIRRHFKLDPPESDVYFRPFSFLRRSNETMKEHLCTLIRCQSALPRGLRQSFDTLLIPFLRELEARERSWVKALGFDSMADQIPNIEEFLFRDGKLRVADGVER